MCDVRAAYCVGGGIHGRVDRISSCIVCVSFNVCGLIRVVWPPFLDVSPLLVRQRKVVRGALSVYGLFEMGTDSILESR